MNIHNNFTWGVATSAYQIEGAPAAGGKGESVWDRFTHTAGTVADGSTGDVACDHYHRWEEDVALMADLGVDAYRFSIAWTRVIPDGVGNVNPVGLDFYDRLVDGLLAAGITPYVTLYHWDLPQAIQDAGGWPHRFSVDAFARYAAVVAEGLGDRVKHWITHNEPWVSAFLGHLVGTHAPGIKDWGTALAAGHHLLLSHGRAVDAIRSAVANARVGIALDCRPAKPASGSAADADAHRHFDGFRNRWFFDPVFGKGYPADMVHDYVERGYLDGADLSFVHTGDFDAIGVPIDFLGLNYYTTISIAARSDETEATGVKPGPTPPSGYTGMGWPITPEGLPEFLHRIHREYTPPSIIITENGAGYWETAEPGVMVDDTRRIDYLDTHIAGVQDAVAGGVPVDGYFVWTLVDNFEWALGFGPRFGLVRLEPDTGRRTPKRSYEWYRDLIRSY